MIEQVEDALELGTGEGALRFGNDECVPATVWVLQILQNAGCCRASVPRQAATLVDVVVGGDDRAMRGNEPLRRGCLPSQAIDWVLQVCS
jgi:hypothetical protein